MIEYLINTLIITLNPYKLAILIGSIDRLILIYYFKKLFKIIIKKVVVKDLKGLLILKRLIERKIKEIL